MTASIESRITNAPGAWRTSHRPAGFIAPDEEGYRRCSNCVMDTTDPRISFDKEGVCDHCHGFHQDVQPHWHTDERGRAELEAIVKNIKKDGEGRDFDCLIGISGGLDSSYMCHVAVREFGLRPLVFHVDGGWNSQIAVGNIESLIDGLGLDLYTEVIDWEEMKDFQLAYFKAGVSNIDIPQDHAFIATLYHFANKHRIKYILNGGNYSTECVRNPLDFFYYATDMRQIHDIQRRFGRQPLQNYPLSGILFHKVYLRYLRGVRVVKPLNYVPFVKQQAIAVLQQEYNWQSYPRKHFESRFTRFYEGYWLPTKFGFDSRKVQFSSLILTGQMSREEALEALSRPGWDSETIVQDFEYIATKLGIPVAELLEYRDAPNKSYRDYNSSKLLFTVGGQVMKLLGLERAVKR
ncbi:MAG: LPS biosynthesis protein [Rickettsiales bacterium]|nr:LPS biosynthesis protein [Rickettsiales bacterium]|tara:strand:- start:2008 stop:3228 length:1221 start_codon:yes stop_codon:yes gene_type:complete